MVFFSSHVWMWKLDHKEGWAQKNWCFWTMVLEKTVESPLDCKEIKPVNTKGNQSWIFIGRTDAEATILCLPDAKSWLFRKDLDAEKDWRQEEKGMTEDEMVGWHHWLNGPEFKRVPGDGEGQRSLTCCNSCDCKESDMTEWLNWRLIYAKTLQFVPANLWSDLSLKYIFPSTRVFSNESVLHIRYWNFSISPSNEYSELISFRIDRFDLLAVQGTLKNLLQQHSSKASILWRSAFFMVQLSHLFTTTGKTIALTT